jgi:tRNA pseudouridine55 synthase
MAEERRRGARRRVDGVLLLDKPPGLSSNAALQRAKRLFDAQKAGHAGTLDPLATGLLPICFGEATKFAQALLDARKRYLASVHFGIATTTGDAEGEVIDRKPVAFAREALEAAVARFTGTIRQTPPAYAALKRDGRAYYDYARAGVAIERTPREVIIHALRLLDWSPPHAVLDVDCSKGTYVRVLAEDLGIALDSVAHLSGLRRTAAGGFSIDDAIELDALEALDEQARLARLLPVDAAVASLPMLQLDALAASHLAHGRRLSHAVPPGRYRVYGPGGFIGLVEATGDELRAERLLATSG